MIDRIITIFILIIIGVIIYRYSKNIYDFLYDINKKTYNDELYFKWSDTYQRIFKSFGLVFIIIGLIGIISIMFE